MVKKQQSFQLQMTNYSLQQERAFIENLTFDHYEMMPTKNGETNKMELLRTLQQLMAQYGSVYVAHMFIELFSHPQMLSALENLTFIAKQGAIQNYQLGNFMQSKPKMHNKRLNVKDVKKSIHLLDSYNAVEPFESSMRLYSHWVGGKRPENPNREVDDSYHTIKGVMPSYMATYALQHVARENFASIPLVDTYASQNDLGRAILACWQMTDLDMVLHQQPYFIKGQTEQRLNRIKTDLSNIDTKQATQLMQTMTNYNSNPMFYHCWLQLHCLENAVTVPQLIELNILTPYLGDIMQTSPNDTAQEEAQAKAMFNQGKIDFNQLTYYLEGLQYTYDMDHIAQMLQQFQPTFTQQQELGETYQNAQVQTYKVLRVTRLPKISQMNVLVNLMGGDSFQKHWLLLIGNGYDDIYHSRKLSALAQQQQKQHPLAPNLGDYRFASSLLAIKLNGHQLQWVTQDFY